MVRVVEVLSQGWFHYSYDCERDQPCVW